MKDAVLALYPEMDIVVKAAAVSDYPSGRSLRAEGQKRETPTCSFRWRKRRIFSRCSADKRSNQVLVGFAAETERLMESAQKKLERKNLDLLVANDVSKGVFGSDSSSVVVLSRSGEPVKLEQQSKLSIAATILDMALAVRLEQKK